MTTDVQPEACSKKTVLIVEDNKLNLVLLERILDSNGYHTKSVDGGEACLAAALEHRPELILMDLQMPGVDGYAAFEALRANAETARVPVVAVTGNALQHDREKIAETGFDAFIIKPYKIDAMLELVNGFLQ